MEQQKKNPRGEELNKAIEDVCEELLPFHPSELKITRSAVQKRLGLKSRSTLIGKRADIISSYASKQLDIHGVSKEAKKRKKAETQLDKLKIENERLKKERDQAISDYCAILNGLKIRGIDVNEVFLPIFKTKKVD